MRWAILGDIHANQAALTAVLRDIARRPVDAMYHLGDVVGYCTDFAAVIETLRREGIRGVHGNHEMMVLGTSGLENAGVYARKAVRWTRRRISADELAYLGDLPARLALGPTVLFHAGPDSCTVRMLREDRAAEAMAHLDGESADWHVAFHGHIHRQQVYVREDGVVRLNSKGAGQVDLRPEARYLVCPGSVGISRDRDPRAAYAVYDLDKDSLEFKRIEYDWRRVRRGLRRAGLRTPLFAPKWKRVRNAVIRVETVLERLFPEPGATVQGPGGRPRGRAGSGSD